MSKKEKKVVEINLASYDAKNIQETADEIVRSCRAKGAVVFCIPLPTRIKKYTVLRSPHVDRKSREQFEMRTHKRVLQIVNPSAQALEKLKSLSVPASVNIRVHHHAA